MVSHCIIVNRSPIKYFQLNINCIFKIIKLTQALFFNSGSNLIFFLIFTDLFGCTVLVAACGIVTCSLWTFSCGMWNVVPWQGIEPRSPAWAIRSLSHWTKRKGPLQAYFQITIRFRSDLATPRTICQNMLDQICFYLFCVFSKSLMISKVSV